MYTAVYSGEKDAAGRRRASGRFLLLALAAVNLAVWALAIIVFHRYPLLLGTALIAYSFGLRHAFDADHIAAIDNVVRKLVAGGERPVATGLYFSLGHSTVVFLLSALVAFFAGTALPRAGAFPRVGEVAGTLISSGLLFAIAAANVAVLISVLRALARVRAGGAYDEDSLDQLLSARGFLARIFRRLFALVGKSRHMYLIGFLFGLGFDTATEIGLIGLSAAEASKGLPILAIMVFPLLFAAGMALVDSLDSVMMVGAYTPRLDAPVWKLTYNAAVTALSVLVAFAIGGIELLQLMRDSLALSGPFWRWIDALNQSLGWAGFAVVGAFAAIWLSFLCARGGTHAMADARSPGSLRPGGDIE